jgi:DNA-binding NtrC family response regulator
MEAMDTVDGIRASARGLKALLEEYERGIILAALAEAGGHQRRAAASLGLLPTTLSEKMKRLGLRERSEPS